MYLFIYYYRENELANAQKKLTPNLNLSSLVCISNNNKIRVVYTCFINLIS